MVSEISREEEVTVFLIICHVQFERCELHTALARHTLGSRFFLRHHSLQLEFAKLHVGSHTEKTACSLDERGVARERYITSLYKFDDFILLAVILQFHVLGIVIEGGIGVVVHVHVHLVAHLSVHVEVDFLIEVHHRGLTVADRQGRIVDVLLVDTKLQFGASLGLHTDTARTEYLLGRS